LKAHLRPLLLEKGTYVFPTAKSLFGAVLDLDFS